MQQLTLFSNNTSRPIRKTRRSSTARNARNADMLTPRWDLWTQENDTEKEMALFFLDIRNFTPLIERHQAVDVIHIVKKLFSTFQNIIRIHHGRIIETTGDGFYAAFGFDQNIEGAVNASVQAGLAILETLKNLNKQTFERNLQQQINVGIGVHVGKVATGNLHLGYKDHFVVMGYPVNVASRIQAATKQLNNNFIVSSAVFRLLKESGIKDIRMKVNLKGVTDALEVHLIGKPYSV